MKLNLKIFILLFSCSTILFGINQKKIINSESTKTIGTIKQVVQKTNEKGAI